MKRIDGRAYDELRPVRIIPEFQSFAEGSVLIELGKTRVVCSVSVEERVPNFLRGSGTGWITAEYSMLPRATVTRTPRDISQGRIAGRSQEIQRLIGRSLRAVTDFKKLGERTVYIDCDVINADGGTRVGSIIGAAVSLYDAGTWLVENNFADEHIVKELVAAISVGIVDGTMTVDLSYEEDSTADVDMNIVMTESGKLVEVQGTAEGKPFDRKMLDEMLDAAQSAIHEIIAIQKSTLGLT